MNREEQKEIYEKEVFLSFVKMANLDIDINSIKKGNENNKEPDILCKFNNGNWVGYELGRLTDSRLRETINSREPKNGEYIRTRDRSNDITKNKLSKKYSEQYPTELLLYRENPMITPDNVIITTIKPTCESNHNYHKIWFMGDNIEILYENN